MLFFLIISCNSNDNYIELLLSIEQSKNSEKIKELREKWIIDTVVIDPGHGGKDPGAIGVNNIKEKDIALDISKQLGKMIERSLGLKVIYTRDEDIFIPLWKRTQIANNSGGDIFISIDRVRENAVEFGKEFNNELSRVIIHGVLHLIGYRDKSPEEKAQMREKEDIYLNLLS